MTYLKLHDNPRARDHATKALEMDNSSVKAYFRRGQVYHQDVNEIVSWPHGRYAQHFSPLPNLLLLCLYSPLGSSKHYLIVPSCCFCTTMRLSKEPVFGTVSALWKDLKYFSDFPWNDNCIRVRNPYVCAEHIMEVIISVMEAHICHAFSLPHAKIPQFIHVCSHAIKDRLLFIFLSRIIPNVSYDLTKLSSQVNAKILQTLILPEMSGILPKISPVILLLHFSLLNSDGTATVTSVSKAELFSWTFC